MGSLSLWHWIIVGAVLLLVFGGKGKVSDLMGDVAKGIKSFKKGLADDDEKPEAARPVEAPRVLDHQTITDASKVSETHRAS
ncbi:twin-arginine translocase TatA/TatE family subunit [Beijerinckia mobilis]|uniref:twin-arginine translocase TatA/TatE family subunit n=1 Tax=Beijerinckia mobilis TaxID=231434 RepID=UPI00054EC888|nr:twin-arginine translocase TatA/TatE family subunit [Beijerinckia mobilis]